jgi:hypothetical protein
MKEVFFCPQNGFKISILLDLTIVKSKSSTTFLASSDALLQGMAKNKIF